MQAHCSFQEISIHQLVTYTFKMHSQKAMEANENKKIYPNYLRNSEIV